MSEESLEFPPREREVVGRLAQWRTIETAPHGEPVLLGWVDYFTREWVYEVGQASQGWRRGAYSTMSAHGQATHWMPLPAPPPPSDRGEDGR